MLYKYCVYIGSSSSQEALNNEQADSANANEEIFPKDTPASTAAIVPSKFISKDDFFTTWLSWKDEFLTYIKDIDKEEANRNIWGIMLLNRMGPVGQEIYRTFSFYDKNTEEDINVLIKKFDIYCMYRDKKKVNEDIDKYVNDLKVC